MAPKLYVIHKIIIQAKPQNLVGRTIFICNAEARL